MMAGIVVVSLLFLFFGFCTVLGTWRWFRAINGGVALAAVLVLARGGGNGFWHFAGITFFALAVAWNFLLVWGMAAPAKTVRNTQRRSA